MANEVGVFFSLVFFLVGISYLASPKAWAQLFQETAEKPYGGFLFAMVCLPMGLVILSFHNNWSLQFSLFITLSGWSMVGKAIAGLLFPTLYAPFFKNTKRVISWITTGGAFLAVLSALSGLSFFW